MIDAAPNRLSERGRQIGECTTLPITDAMKSLLVQTKRYVDDVNHYLSRQSRELLCSINLWIKSQGNARVMLHRGEGVVKVMQLPLPVLIRRRTAKTDGMVF